ncbi:Hypothetical_protein [Hexamita inflata]|uniref:Hypothetical_protein n=1 Tax=Hexamita inflata TaxID=28002 RepID=A0ABP1J5Y0_9EUKA
MAGTKREMNIIFLNLKPTDDIAGQSEDKSYYVGIYSYNNFGSDQQMERVSQTYVSRAKGQQLRWYKQSNQFLQRSKINLESILIRNWDNYEFIKNGRGVFEQKSKWFLNTSFQMQKFLELIWSQMDFNKFIDGNFTCSLFQLSILYSQPSSPILLFQSFRFNFDLVKDQLFIILKLYVYYRFINNQKQPLQLLHYF